MTNGEIAGLLRNVAAAFSIKDDKKYRFQIIAYEKASDTIKNAPAQIADLVREGKLEGLPGIGASMRSHLEELVKTGKVKHFEQILSFVPAAMFPLLDIPSFGPKKAYKLVQAFKLKNPKTVMADIEKHAKKGEIAKLDGFGEKSEQDILRAIAEFREGYGKTTRMLLPFATELAETIIAYLKKSPAVLQASPLGSLRRKKDTIGDIDIAVATNTPEKVIAHFTAYPFKERIIEEGPATASLLTSGGHQVDLMTQPLSGFGSLLQHFTGSKHHNVHLRDYALKRNLSLSEKGIKHLGGKEKGETSSYKTEESFYHALGMDWIPPEIREDTGEIELAVKHNLPKLIDLSDIRGDFHIHSSYPIEPSHDMGEDSMEKMLQKAKQLQYEYIAFSEHNPSVSQHTEKQINTILARRRDKIEQIKKSNKHIRVINMLETDILVNGKLAIGQEAFDFLDATIVSIHSSFGMDKEVMTKRVLEGLSHPKAKILAHPTGRLINERAGYELDWEQIFTFAKEHKKALEVNSWPSRLDLPDGLIRKAVEKGVHLVISTDSHALSHMDLMRYGVWIARRGWATKKDIVNSWDYDTLMAWLTS